MCEEYQLVNKLIHFDKYAMLLPKWIFDTLGQAKVFNTMDLWFNYHQLVIEGRWQGQNNILGCLYTSLFHIL
jgi:hypothetical protein